MALIDAGSEVPYHGRTTRLGDTVRALVHLSGDDAVIGEARALMPGDSVGRALDRLQAGELTPEPQDEQYATYANKLDKQEARLDWSQSAIQLHRQVRAFNPWPLAQTALAKKILRVWAAEPLDQAASAPPGTFSVMRAATPRVFET